MWRRGQTLCNLEERNKKRSIQITLTSNQRASKLSRFEWEWLEHKTIVWLPLRWVNLWILRKKNLRLRMTWTAWDEGQAWDWKTTGNVFLPWVVGRAICINPHYNSFSGHNLPKSWLYLIDPNWNNFLLQNYICSVKPVYISNEITNIQET